MNKYLYLIVLLFNGILASAQTEQRLSLTSAIPSIYTNQDYSPWLDDDLQNLVQFTWGNNDPNSQYIDVTLKLASKSKLKRISLYDHQGQFPDRPVSIYALNGTEKIFLGYFYGTSYMSWVDIAVNEVIADAVIVHKYGNDFPQKVQAYGFPITSDPGNVKVNTLINFEALADRRSDSEPFHLEATSNNNEAPIVFTSSNSEIVSVSNSTGVWKATTLKEGVVTITASQAETNNFFYSSVSRTLVVTNNGIDKATADNLYVSLSGNYVNPTWIGSIPWNKISGKPNTLQGYGITDANTSSFSSYTDITYSDLVSAINNSTLKPTNYYRITDFQTVHKIAGTSPEVINTGPIEPLIVFAIAPNKISAEAHSEIYPQDEIKYTISNTAISGATKGCILKRKDNLKNVSVSFDFRNIKFRRYRLAPPAWSSGVAYTKYQPVLYDNAVYFCNKTGVPVGDIPSPSSDNWVQMFPDNSYYLSSSNSNYTLTTSNNFNNSVRNVVVPVNANDYVDLPFVSNYDALTLSQFHDVNLSYPALSNIVIQHKNQAFIMGFVDFHGTTTATLALDQGYMFNCNFEQGISSSTIFLKGTYIRYWDVKAPLISSTFNLKQLHYVNGGFRYCMIRSICQASSFNEIVYSILPDTFRELQTANTIGNLKFLTNATLRNVQFPSNFGIHYATVQGTYANILSADNGDVNIAAPLENKIFIGSFDAYNNQKYVQVQAMVDKASSANIIAWTGTEAVDLLKSTGGGTATVDEGNLVHRTGDEPIAGIKTFSNNTIFSGTLTGTSAAFNSSLAVGTSNTGEYKLAVGGSIKAVAIKVDPTQWFDDVFDNSYKLPALADIEKYIQANKHLPDVPSEKEVKKGGIELGEMSGLLLKKVEELTLYMIEMKKENERLKDRVEELEQKNLR